MDAVEILAIVAATGRQLLRARQHVLDVWSAVRQSLVRIEQLLQRQTRRWINRRDAHEIMRTNVPRLRPESWPCGIRIPDGGRPAADGLSALERRKLADRLVASLRAIGFDCEVIGPDTFPARGETSGHAC